MNDILISALAERIKVDKMKIEQVPEVYRDDVEKLLS